jgi:hypothetical protein
MIDVELIHNCALEIGILHRKIMNAFPQENELILKHLSASAIHMALFMTDFLSILTNEKLVADKKTEDIFLKDCGCNMNE